MIVVSDASPLVGLASIRQLELLRQLYGKVHIPEAVWQEVVVDGAGQPGSIEVENAKWIKRHQVANTQLVHSLLQYLDEGESEAIALAIELKAELLIIDERLGRDTARHFGLNFTGIIGLLVDAKHKGLIDEVKRYLDELRNVFGFRISEGLYRRVLTDEGEWLQYGEHLGH